MDNCKIEAKIAEAIASIVIPEPTSAKSRWYNKKWYAVGDSFTQLGTYVGYLNQYIGFSSTSSVTYYLWAKGESAASTSVIFYAVYC